MSFLVGPGCFGGFWGAVLGAAWGLCPPLISDFCFATGSSG